MTLFRGYEPADQAHVTTGPQPGALALMAWFLDTYRVAGGQDLGIWGVRDIAGSDQLSVHAEGRADDMGVPVGVTWAQGLADELVAFSGELGIQGVIYNRRQWFANLNPTGAWSPYTGSDPHTGHLHVELSRHAAATLTAAQIYAVLGGDMPLNPYLLIRAAAGPATGRVYALFPSGHVRWIGPTEFKRLQAEGAHSWDETATDALARLEAARVDS